METITGKYNADTTQVKTIQGYYKWHAKIYEATRWIFLFGRKRIIEALKLPFSSEKTILEVGCGTGHNLHFLAKTYSKAPLIGVDISPDMLGVAAQKLRRYRDKVQFIEKPYSPGDWTLPKKPDVVLFSYCLTMINPGWDAALQRADDDLAAGDTIAVVDFHGTPLRLFRRLMEFNHVRMDGHLLPALTKRFKPTLIEVHQAYGGLWTYFLFVGRKI